MSGYVDLVLLAILAFAGGCAVVSAWFARESKRMSARGDVDDLAISVERLAKAHRRERMSAMRKVSAEDTDGAPPELLTQTPAVPAQTNQEIKASLRRKWRGNGVPL